MRFYLAVILTASFAALLPAVELKQAIDEVRKVGPDSKNSGPAASAWKDLADADVKQLPAILAGMDGATPLARNWIRAAVDQVLERAKTKKQALPVSDLEAFLRDARHDGKARRFVFELLTSQDKTVPDRLLPDMLNDPSLELRRDAVARLLEDADKALKADKKDVGLQLFKKGLTAARDRDQVDRVIRQLRELGQQVDQPAHLGLIVHWKTLGPFPNVDQKGVDTVYPPEKHIDLNAEYEGKVGKIRWKDYVSKDDTAQVDWNAATGQDTESVAYALAEFTSSTDRAAEIRLGCFTVFKLWLNGELVMERGDAYAGMRYDHYVAKVNLKKGKNQILLKACQAVPPDPLPKIWRFLLRVCDESGGGIVSTTRLPWTPTEKKS